MKHSQPNSALLLRLLGQQHSPQEACREAGLDHADFQAWWRDQLKQRVPDQNGRRPSAVSSPVRILRDQRGVPHIHAASDLDLYTGYGYAMAQDRLWQLDYYRRQAHGRLAEILGAKACPEATGGAPTALQRDTIARTIGFARIAKAQWQVMQDSTAGRLKAFAKGINQLMEETQDSPPIECALLGYAPKPWHPIDTLAIWCEFQYYLTVRLPVVYVPEIARRHLGDGPLYEAFLQGEADAESILPPGALPASLHDPVGQAVGDPEEAVGSNNWTVAGSRSRSGHPLLASDPHIAFNAVSCWYEAHLADGAGLDAAGAGYIGVPGLLFGRNRNLAFGITNNICSQRDLYRERTDTDHPNRFLSGGKWIPARSLTERIEVKDADPVDLEVVFSPTGPIVDHLLPEAARGGEPVSLRWMGATLGPDGQTERGAEIGVLMQTNRARTCDEFRAALADWRVPTLSMVFADTEGNIGYQCTGAIPIRRNWHRGYRKAWEPEDAWQGVVPFRGLPAMSNPQQGWIRTANNRTAGDDYPYPLSGTWASGHRAQRVRQLLEADDRMTRQACMEMQADTLSLRARDCLSHLLHLLDGHPAPLVREAAVRLQAWDCHMEPDAVGGALFETFFAKWQLSVASQRFPPAVAVQVADSIAGLANALLASDPAGWFENEQTRRNEVSRTMLEICRQLETQLGTDMDRWTWGRLHRIHLHHPLTYIKAIGELLDRGGHPVGGSGVTVCNTGMDPNYAANMGANYRIVAELEPDAPDLYSIDAAGQSGHPGSEHYCDQLPDWLAGNLATLSLASADDLKNVEAAMILVPHGSDTGD